MKSHELFRNLLGECNAKQLADRMGLSTSTIYKWAEPSANGGSGTQNPLDRVQQLMELTNASSIAQWVSGEADGFYVKNPHVPRNSTHAVVIAANKIVQEFADMLSLVATAALDNTITEKEAREIRDRWECVKSTTEEFTACCEQGNFDDIHTRAKQRVN
jgi:transcriptional regulator with XRE-family HTH domain